MGERNVMLTDCLIPRSIALFGSDENSQLYFYE